MLWRCPACNRQTEEPVCSRCQTPMESGEPSDATGLIKETCGSVLYLVAVICFTAALILSIVVSWIPNKNTITLDTDEIKTAISDFEEDTGLQFNPRERKAILNLVDEANENETVNVDTVVNSENGSFPLLSILACIGLWLLLAQGYNARASLQKGGPILLKIATIIGEVVSIIAVVCGALLCVGLWMGRPGLVAVLNEQDGDALAESFRVLLSSDIIMWGLLILCGMIVVAGILYTLFFIFATRTVNGILHTAKTGHFGKNASLFNLLLETAQSDVEIIIIFIQKNTGHENHPLRTQNKKNLVQCVLELLAWTEFDDFASRDSKGFTRTGVASLTCIALLNNKGAQTGKRQFGILAKRLFN